MALAPRGRFGVSSLRLMRLFLLALAVLLAGSASAQPASRLFLVPTARPVATSVEIGTRFVVPSVEGRIGERVSVGVTGLVLPRDAGGINGAGAADFRVTLVDREQTALALGATGSASYSSGDAHGYAPASLQLYAVGTVGGEGASATLGVGVLASGGPRYDYPDCPVCSYDPGFVNATYSIQVQRRPSVFGGAEAEVGRNGAFGYRLVGEGAAVPLGDGYFLLGGGGLRITRKAARLDLGAMVGSDPYGSNSRETGVAPWIGFTAGF